MTFSVTILGSSSALPTPSRFSTAQVLNVLERFFLIYCGEGTQIQLNRYKIRSARIHHIFISHLHGDHFLGIFGLISSMNLLGRKHTLHIYGPFKLKALIDLFIATMDKGINFDIIFHPLQYNGLVTIHEDDKVMVQSFPLRHRVPTCGFLFKEKPRLRSLKPGIAKDLSIPIKYLSEIKEGADYTNEKGTFYNNESLTNTPPEPRSFAFVSDTAKNPKIIPYIKNANLLYHEATYANEGKKRAKDTGHSTALQAAEIALKAEVNKLILGHFSNRYKDLTLLQNEAKELFNNTEVAEDGAVFNIPLQQRI